MNEMRDTEMTTGSVMTNYDFTVPVEDYVLNEDQTISVHARRSHDDLTGYVYLGVTVVYTYRSHVDAFPAGIEDFASIALRRFAERLAEILGETEAS